VKTARWRRWRRTGGSRRRLPKRRRIVVTGTRFSDSLNHGCVRRITTLAETVIMAAAP
jgi:hypothetical protein